MKFEPFPEPDDVGDLPLADAERVVRQALAQAEVSHGPDDLRVAGRLVQLGRLLLVIGERGGEQAKAGPPLRRALAIAGAAYGGQDPRLLELLELLARQIMSTSQGPEAEELRQRALAIAEATYGPDHPEVAVAVGRLAGQYPYDPKHAEPLRRRALRIDEAALGPNHPRVADDLAALASSLQEFDTSHDLGAGEMVFDGKGGHVIRRPAPPPDRSAEVEVLLRRALEVAEAAHGPDHPAVAARLSELAAVLGARGKPAEAEALLRRVLAVCEAAHGPLGPQLLGPLRTLRRLLQIGDRLQPAEEEALRARELAITEAVAATRGPSPLPAGRS